MTKTGFPLTLLAATLACALHAELAQAQPARVFVAAQGNDGNPCTIAAPCLTFQRAHDTVAAGGVIDALNPADYGSLMITKAISIQGHGFAGIGVPLSGFGILIAGAATDAVTLNGLLIEPSELLNGIGLGFGIVFVSGKSLVVENCVVRNVGPGVQFQADATTLQTLSVSNSYFTDLSSDGIVITKHNSGAVTAAIERAAFYGNGQFALDLTAFDGTINAAVTDSSIVANRAGFFISAGPPAMQSLVLTRVSVVGNGKGIEVRQVNTKISLALTQSIVANNSAEGVMAYGTNNATTSLALTQSAVVGNDTGVMAYGTNTTMRIAQSTVMRNGTGYWVGAGAVILSYGDNYIDDNGGNYGALGSASKR